MESNEDKKKKSIDKQIIMLTPAPTHRDYMFNMDKNEGIFDLFDIDTNKKQ